MDEPERIDLTGRRWRIRAPKERFEQIRQDPEFRAVVKLARAANAVLFCQLLLIDDKEDDPRTQRVRMNAFLYLCPILYEALEFSKALLGRHLRTYSAFDTRFKPLFRDKEVAEFVEGTLKKIRNEGVVPFYV